MSENTPGALEEYARQHPADLADQLQRLETETAVDILLQLPRSQAAQALDEMEEETAEVVLSAMTSEQLVEIIGELPANESADLIAQLAESQQEAVLEELPDAKSDPIEAILSYREDSAGGIMSDRLIRIQTGMTVREGLDEIRNRQNIKEVDVSYIYVIDTQQRLVGVIPLRDLVFGDGNRRIEDVMLQDVKYVSVDDDQEEIARKFERYHYLGLPVLDAQGKIVGMVKMSDAMQVARDEATEDMQLMVGLSGEERALTPWRKSMVKRLPWLYLNLATALLAAIVVGFFESTISQWTALAIFLPIIAGQGGNAGMQTLTVIIRDMALGELSPGDGRRAFYKEVMLGIFNGLAIGFVVGLIGYIWKGDVSLGIVAGTAMALNQIAAAAFGVLIPYGLKAIKVDPAMASSIFLTTVTDVAGFFFFLGLAFLALKYF